MRYVNAIPLPLPLFLCLACVFIKPSNIIDPATSFEPILGSLLSLKGILLQNTGVSSHNETAYHHGNAFK